MLANDAASAAVAGALHGKIHKRKEILTVKQKPRGTAAPSSGKPPAFRRIRSNVYTRRAPHKFSLDDVVVCCCDPSLGDTCSDDACLNALTSVECDEKRCPCGEACANQRFRRRVAAPHAVLPTPGRGWVRPVSPTPTSTSARSFTQTTQTQRSELCPGHTRDTLCQKEKRSL